MHDVFAGARSVPVINQALVILGEQFNLPVMDDEEYLDPVPPDAVFLAACKSGASFPSRVLRLMPLLPKTHDEHFKTVLEKRLKENAERRYGLNEQVLKLRRLVLVRPARSNSGRYEGDDLVSLTTALKDLAGIKPVKAPRVRSRNTGNRLRECGLQPYLVA